MGDAEKGRGQSPEQEHQDQFSHESVTPNLARTFTELVSLDRVLAVLSLLAAVVGPAYLFGFLAVWVEISTSYDQSYATAWYTTSLVPRSTIIGHSAILVAKELPYIVIASWVTYWAALKIRQQTQGGKS